MHLPLRWGRLNVCTRAGLPFSMAIRSRACTWMLARSGSLVVTTKALAAWFLRGMFLKGGRRGECVRAWLCVFVFKGWEEGGV